MTASPRLGYTQLEQGETVPEVAVNEINLYLEAASGIFNFLDRDLTAPPGSPSELDTYLIAATATGAWAGHDDEIAVFINTAWAFIAPVSGWIGWVDDEGGYIGYDGAAWNALGLTLDDDETLAGDSSAVAPTQHAVKTYVDTEIAGVGGASTTQTEEQISGFIASPSNKSYTIALKMAHAGTITEVTTKSASGTCTATWKINSTALGGTANSVSSSEESQSHASSNAFSAGDDIVLTVSSNSSCADMSFTIKYTRTLA